MEHGGRRWAAGLGGGVAGGLIGFFGGIAISDVFAGSGGLETLGTVMVGVLACTWGAASFGTALGLKLAGAAPARSEIFWTMVMLLPFGGSAGVIATALSDSDDAVPLAGQLVIVAAGVVLAWLVGKRIAKNIFAR